MSSASGKIEQVDLIVNEPDEGAPAEYTAAQAPVVLHVEATAADALAGGRSLKERVVRSSAWTLVAFGFGTVVRLLSNWVMAYLLMPSDWGTVALVSVFVTGLVALSDVGIEQAVIQNKRGDDPVFLNTAWTLHAIRGVILFAGCCLIAYPVYWFSYGKTNASELLVMLPVAGIGPLLNGFNSTKTFSLNRHLRMGRLTALTLVYQLIGAVVPIALAVWWRSPWAFIVGGLASNAFWLFATHAMLPGLSNRFCWDREVRRELMKFGRWIMVSTVITYTAMQVDRPMMFRMMGEYWLGLYAMALTLVRLPSEIIGKLTSVTLFPALAHAAQQRPEDLRSVLWRARGLILTVSLALTVGVVLCGPLVITQFYKSQWHPAGLLAQWACIAAWLLLLQCSADRALLALGKTRALAVSNAVNLVVTVAGGFAGRYLDMRFMGQEGNAGIIGFIIGMSAGKLAGHFVIQLEMARCGIPIFRQDTVYSAALLAACGVGIGLPRMMPEWQAHGFMYNALAAVAVCGATCAWAGVKVLRGIR